MAQVSKECPRWLYEVLRDLQENKRKVERQFAAVDRGEAPSLGGNPLSVTLDHGELTGLVPDDDHTQYALLRGRVGGQTLNGSIDLSTSSTSYPWSDAGVSLMTAGSNSATTSWNRGIDVNAPVNNILIVSLATHSPGAGYGAGNTNYHTSVTDSKGNTWQKLGEYTTAFFAGTEEQTNSLWLCLVTTGMTTAGSDSLTFNFSNSMGVMAVESRQFLGTSGLTFTVAGTATGGNVDSLPPSLTISGLTSREYLFIRGIAVHDTNTITNQVYTATTGHTAFTTNHANSTIPNGGANRGINARGEFKIVTGTADTTNPTLDASGFPDDASLMVAVQIGSNVAGDLVLESINHPQAAKITLHNSTITLNADSYNFRQQGGSTNLFVITPAASTAALANTGTFTLTGHSTGAGTLFTINHNTATDATLDLVIKKSASQTGDMTEWQDSSGTRMSYIRASDGAFVGPVVVSGTDTHIDNVFKILDNGDPSKIAMFEVSAITTATTRTYSLPNVDCTLLATTSVNGQRIGTAAQTGTTDDIATSGRVTIGTANFSTEQLLTVQGNLTNTIGTRQVARITPSISASGTGATYRAALIQLTGGGSITSGAPVAHGLDISATLTIQAAVGVTEIVGLDNTATWSYTNSLATVAAIIGLRGNAKGSSSNFGDTTTQGALWGIQANVTSSGSKTTDLVGIKLTLDSVTKMYGYTARIAGIDMDRFGDTTGVYWGSSSYVCTVTGGSNTLTNVTNVASIHVGQYITGTNIPSGTYVTATNVGALTVTMNNLATGGGVSVTIWGTVGKWIGISCTTPLPIGGEVIAARFINEEVDIPSQHYGKFYLRPPTPSSLPTATAYLHIGAGTATANTAPIKLTSGTLLTTAEAGAIEFLTDDIYFTITTAAARKGIVLNDGTNLTSGRVPFTTTNGRLTDDADFTFAVDTLTVTKIAATTHTGDVTLSDVNLILGTTTGTKVGTATSQKLGFWNAAPIVQPTTAVAAATLVGGGGTTLTDTDTFDGYTLKQIVKALRNTGLLA